MSSAGTSGGYGQQYPSDGNAEFNRTAFLVSQMMALLRTNAIVKVMKVTSAGEVAPATFVDVKILVKMVDGQGTTSSHDVIHGLPYFRLQSGTNGIICDPVVGDIGFAIICDRDISSVKAKRDEASPGSWRQHDLADGAYLGGWPASAPTQYVRFYSGGIDIADANENLIQMKNDGIYINGVKFARDRKISIFVEATADGGHTLTQHVHPGVTAGSDETEMPTG